MAALESADVPPSVEAGDRDCTDAAVPDSVCLAAPVDTTDPLQNETIWVLAWKGDYEVILAVTRSNGADIADAYCLGAATARTAARAVRARAGCP